jgi:hypothetical protein
MSMATLQSNMHLNRQKYKFAKTLLPKIEDYTHINAYYFLVLLSSSSSSAVLSARIVPLFPL